MIQPRKLLLPLAALGLLLLVIAWMAGMFNDRIAPGVEPVTAVADEDVFVAAYTAESITEAVPASVQALEHTIVSSRLLARVSRLLVRSGDVVEAGALLVALEDDDLSARARQSREAVNSVQARLDEASRNLQRMTTMHERGLIADTDLDAAIAAARTLEAELQRARRRVEESEAALSYAQVRAPIGGRIVERFVEPGDTVSPGQAMVSLYNPVSLRVEAWVRESLALSLTEGETLAVEIPALDRQLDGPIEEIVPAADPGARAFMIRVRLPPADSLLPGMYARLRIPAGSAERLLVPAARVRSIGQLDVLWVQGASGSERRFVRLGTARDDDRVDVVAGLMPGDRVLPVPGRSDPD
ncbi:MAG: efflux RND transporter periplasmic adaptor subunit [Chromatocurvus sp.]